MRETYCLFLDAVESGRRDQEKPCIVGGGNRPLVRFFCVSGRCIGFDRLCIQPPPLKLSVSASKAAASKKPLPSFVTKFNRK